MLAQPNQNIPSIFQVFRFSAFLLGLLSTFTLGDSACGQDAVAPVPAAREAAKPVPPAAVRYQVSFENAQAHYVDIIVELEAKEGLELFMPVWTPGSYLVREYARHVDQFTAEDAEGNSLEFERRSKHKWNVPDAKGMTKIQYRLYCAELSVRTNFVDSEFGILNGAATYLTTEALQDLPHEVQFELPPGWQQAVCSLGKRVGSPAHCFRAETFDELVDSPVVLGNPSIHPFEVGDVTHYLVNIGGDGLWEGEKAAADAAKIVAEHQAMWQSVPYDRYYFLNVIAESGGGLEHDFSTLLLTSRWSFRSGSSYQRWLSLVSHEFFHTWNVRRLRPRALTDYDYLNENYFDELWIAEGVTSYYDDLAVVRSGLVEPRDYLRVLSRSINTLQTTPGRGVQSLLESSHDTWIKFYRPNENSKNTSISYYNKGALVAFLLDMKIREATNDEKSLDDVMRWLFENRLEQGYTNQDLLDAAVSMVGPEQSEELQALYHQCIYSTEELDYLPALEWLGLEFPNAPKPEENDVSRADPALGVQTENDDGKLKIKSVTEGSAAYEAGLNVGDELIAVNGFRVGSNLGQVLGQYDVGDAVTVLLSRRGKVREASVVLQGSSSASRWTIGFVKEPSAEQTQRWKSWLHVE